MSKMGEQGNWPGGHHGLIGQGFLQQQQQQQLIMT